MNYPDNVTTSHPDAPWREISPRVDAIMDALQEVNNVLQVAYGLKEILVGLEHEVKDFIDFPFEITNTKDIYYKNGQRYRKIGRDEVFQEGTMWSWDSRDLEPIDPSYRPIGQTPDNFPLWINFYNPAPDPGTPEIDAIVAGLESLKQDLQDKLEEE